MRFKDLINEAMGYAKRSKSDTPEQYAMAFLAQRIANLEGEIETLKRNGGMTDSELDVMLVDMAQA